MKYRPEIDGLRAIAVIPVILFHANVAVFGGGYVGVDIFFVISGYLITTIILQDLKNNCFSYADFLERRARRIMPVLLLVMLACVPFSLALMSTVQIKDFSQSLFSTNLFLSNVLFWLESGYFSAAAEEKPLLHTWTLAVEWQYYVIFPLCLIVARRLSDNRAFWVIVISALVSLILSEWISRFEPEGNFYLLPTRAWELLAGSICAFIIEKKGLRQNNSLSLLGLFLICFSIFFYDQSTPFPSVYTLLPVLGTVLIVLFGSKGTFIEKLLSTKILVSIGLTSYSAYLWHQPLLAFTKIKTIGPIPEAWLLLLVGVLCVLSWLSWRFVETPFRSRRKISTKLYITCLLPLCALIIIFGFLGHKTNGFERFLITKEQRQFLSSARYSPKREECHASTKKHLKYDESCQYFDGNAKIAVLGDSHVVELAYALATYLKDKEISIRHLSYSGCVPSYKNEVAGYELCSKWTDEVVDGVINDSKIEAVVVSYRMVPALYGPNHLHYSNAGNEPYWQHHEAVWHSLVNMIKALNDSNKKVIYVLQAPELPKHISSLLPQNKKDAVSTSEMKWRETVRFIYDNLNDFPQDVEIIDPTSFFCDGRSCFVGNSGNAYYFDDDHMSVYGASLVAEEIIKKIFLDTE